MKRKESIKTGEIYHVFNRSLNQLTIFPTTKVYDHALISLWYYQYPQSLSLSSYLRLSQSNQQQYLQDISSKPRTVDIICFSLMPNHFHLIIRQNIDKSVSRYLANFQNCLTRYFNLKFKHQGQIFCPQFKGKHLEDNNAINHACRYVLLNPVMSYIVNFNQLDQYPYTSYPECVGNQIFNHQITQPQIFTTMFRDKNHFITYIKDEVDYKRQLEDLKYLLYDE